MPTATASTTADDKHCLRCHGFCPSGTLPTRLCLDCEAYDSPEELEKRAFALALAARSPYWFRVVFNNSLVRCI